jgi:hypothetical protein
MNQSENIHELAAALSKAQAEMGAATKNKTNPHFKYRYADLGTVWDVVRPVLSKNGLCVMQTTELSEDGSKVMLVTILAHTSGQWMKSSVPLNPAKNDSQGMGAAMTYMRRYSLSAMLGVVCDEDDDGETAVGRGPFQEKKEIKKETLNEQQIKGLVDILNSMDKKLMNETIVWYKDHFKVERINDIPASAYVQCATVFTARLKEANMKAVV